MHAIARPMSLGFTLVELMVVLVILAGLLAIAVPEFAHLYARVRVATEQQDIEAQLVAMPQKVRLSGRGGVLIAKSTSLYPGMIPQAPAEPPAFVYLEQGRTLSLDLPDDWTVAVSHPIVYHFTGACDGGEIILSLAAVSLRYVLNAPLCRPLLANAATP